MSKRRIREPNPDMPSTAISFPVAQLELLRRMAEADDRSLASLVRRAVDSFLRSNEGRELARKAQRIEAAIESASRTPPVEILTRTAEPELRANYKTAEEKS